MARMQRINDLDLTLEPLSDSIVEVVYQEQVGWFGVNLGEDADSHPFAWTTDPDSRTHDGLLGAHPAADPAQALDDLSAQLASMQSVLEEERTSDPRHNLGAFLDTLPQTESKKEGGWRNLVSGGLRGVNRSKDILQDRASKSRDVLQDRASKSKDILQDRASKSRDVLQDRASKSKDILQDRASKGMDVLQDRASRSKDVLQDRASKGRDVLQDRASRSKDVLQDRASKGRDVLQDRASKGIEAIRVAASPALACEREGHVFDDIRLIGSSNNLPRFCRRCRTLIYVGEGNEGAAGSNNTGRQESS